MQLPVLLNTVSQEAEKKRPRPRDMAGDTILLRQLCINVFSPHSFIKYVPEVINLEFLRAARQHKSLIVVRLQWQAAPLTLSTYIPPVLSSPCRHPVYHLQLPTRILCCNPFVVWQTDGFARPEQPLDALKFRNAAHMKTSSRFYFYSAGKGVEDKTRD